MDLSVLNCLGGGIDFCAQSWRMHTNAFIYFIFDMIAWVFVHSIALLTSCYLHSLFKGVALARFFTSFVFLLPTALIFCIHISIPLILFVIGMYHYPEILWDEFFLLYESIPFLGELSLFAIYFGL